MNSSWCVRYNELCARQQPSFAVPSDASIVFDRDCYRFLTPTERLAESLPAALRAWFLRKDENGDGQIAMSEFASIWSREKAVDFASYDQNNDGVITPREYLRIKTGVAAN